MKSFVFFGEQGWLEDPQFRHDAWQEEVLDGHTELGYIEWTINQHQALDTMIDPTALDLIESHAAPSVECQQQYPREDWLGEVEELDTRLGYAAWVVHKVESDLI